MLLNQQGQIVKPSTLSFVRFSIELLWLGCRDRNQKAGAVAMLDLIARPESRLRDEPNDE